ncbi:hypothetical protein BTA30_22215 [Bacillus swezeyi]|uniref:Uncharacterized protein n=1 Tax=Bacillus swezeyi TaxID=1925020 RepID=A0A1R1REZ3_9BACI|nr:hypothetical protein BW143_18735 [Bacillus swezeyi]OMI24550.1 hypothetical protein BTA30_22215 [Bacillus swezeyi]
MLKAADGFKTLLPSLGVVIGYGTVFYALSLHCRSFNTLMLVRSSSLLNRSNRKRTVKQTFLFLSSSTDKNIFSGSFGKKSNFCLFYFAV